MNIQDTLRKRRNEIRRKQPHVAGKADQLNMSFLQRRNYEPIVSFSLQSFGRDDASSKLARLGAFNARRAFAITQDERNLGIRNPARDDTFRKRFKVRAAAAQ